MSYVPRAYHERASVYSKPRVQSVFDPRISTTSFRPGIVPGHEMNDTEFEEDASDLEEYSGRRSEDSVGKRSMTTLSSVDELQTPATGNQEWSGFNFQLDESMLPMAKSVEGPVGPHLFRMSTDSTRELDFYLSMSPTSPEEVRVAPKKAPRARESAPAQAPVAYPPRTSVPLRTWTPLQVAEWMDAQGFDRTIVDTFFINDISGLTLIDLQYEDLKELGITSFGQRHRLWTEIRALKDLKMTGFEEEQLVFEQPAVPEARPESYSVDPKACSDPTSPVDGVISPPGGRRRGRRGPRDGDDIISPAESASIVAIEQLLPKPHKCSKGEACAKWQKQQRKLARIATEFPMEMAQIANAAKAHSPTDSGVAVPSLLGASVVASSDLLGDARPALRLEEESLRNMGSRDPQENVRRFLDFQHVLPQPATEKNSPPGTPPYEMFPPLSPPNPQPPHAQLRTLPKLTIPMAPVVTGDVQSANRTAKPAAGRVASPLGRMSQYPVVHDPWRIGTPASEMDVPVTAIPLGPIERDVSSSVPPDMRYGSVNRLSGAVNGSRSSSRTGFRDNNGPPPSFHMPQQSSMTRSASRRRAPSLTLAPPPLREETAAEAAALAHESSPTEMDMDDGEGEGDVTPRADEHGHDGWMKKRRTKMLRHEWQDAHFRLRGTRLAMHADERARSALEYIDVDDYAVAVTAASGSSKLNAAFRRLHLNSKTKGLDPAAFAFQLTPAASEKQGVRHAATGKTHHFAVNTANERIDWMRELMLARARKHKDGEIVSFG